MRIKPGCGYWDVTDYGYGGSFRRANENTRGTFIREFKHKGQHEVELLLENGRKAIVKKKHIEED